MPTKPVPNPVVGGTGRSLFPATPMRRLLHNLAHLFSGKAAAGLMSLVYLVIVTHRLGARDYGILVLLNSYAVLAGSLIAFSGFHGVVRFGTLALKEGDRTAFARLIRLMAAIELGCGMAAILAAALLAPLAGSLLHWPTGTTALAVPYSLAVLGTVRATPQGVLQIAGRFDLIAVHQALASPLVRFAGSLIVLLFGGGLHAFILVWLASSVVEGLAMWALAWPSWKKLAPREPLFGPVSAPHGAGSDFGRFILTTNFDITLRELAPNLVPLTVGLMLGPAAAGLLALAKKGTALLEQPTALLAQASYAIFADHNASGDIASLRATAWRSAAMASAFAILLLLVLEVAGDYLLRLLGGHSFADGKDLLLMIAAGTGLLLATTPFAVSLTALGKPQRSFTVGVVANLALFPLLPLLLWQFGIAGAGVHAIIQGIAASAALTIFFILEGRRSR